jgi:hypothetical protein
MISINKLIPFIACGALILPAAAQAQEPLSATYGRDAQHFKVDHTHGSYYDHSFSVDVRPFGVKCDTPVEEPQWEKTGPPYAPIWTYQDSSNSEYQYPGPGDYTVCAYVYWREVREQNPEAPIEPESSRTTVHDLVLEVTSVELNKELAEAQVEEAAFTPANASAALKAHIIAEHPNAIFPAHEGLLCPEIYPNESTGQRYSLCYAEFKTGSVWHLVGAIAHEGSTITVDGLHDSRWHRHWATCSLRGFSGGPQKVHGTLVANNGCDRGPQTDAYFIAIEGYYGGRFRPRSSLGWQFVQSAGFTSLGVFHRQGHSYTFTNAVGDSFRYTP